MRAALGDLLRRDALAVVLLLLLALLPWLGVGSGHAMALLARAMILGLAALGVSLLVGGAGLATLGHAATAGIGAYAAAFLAEYAPAADGTLALAAAIAAAALFSLLAGLVVLRTDGVHFIMITLAFGQMLFFVAGSLTALGGDDGYTLPGRSTLLGGRLLEGRLGFHYACLALLACTWLALRTLLDSRFGRVLRAAAGNPRRVRALGFDPYPYRLLAYVVAGATGGAAGFLLANSAEFVSPAYLSWQRSGELLFMVILGGAARLPGALLGACAYVLLEEWLSGITEHWRMIFGPLLILAVLALRDGLCGLPATAARWLRRERGRAVG